MSDKKWKFILYYAKQDRELRMIATLRTGVMSRANAITLLNKELSKPENAECVAWELK